MTYECILVEIHGRVGIVTLNRPKALNALNPQLINELNAALRAFDSDEAVGAIVITGSEKAFAAGADIKNMAAKSFQDVFFEDLFADWDGVARARKPVVAAVAGFALGGGCELAMMCDFVIAADTARFGQPEINLGLMPGAGGTQRMARSIGKAKTMDLCLTGRFMDAKEAEACGLVARVVPAAELMAEALKAAEAIAAKSLLSIMLVKETVNRAFETPLSEGLRYERRACHSLFATEDQKEGMAAFIEKRPAQFKNR